MGHPVKIEKNSYPRVVTYYLIHDCALVVLFGLLPIVGNNNEHVTTPDYTLAHSRNHQQIRNRYLFHLKFAASSLPWSAASVLLSTMEDAEKQRRHEAILQESQPQTLQQYLEARHSLDLDIQVVTQPYLTTQGDTVDPTGRIFPPRIVPWGDFTARQEANGRTSRPASCSPPCLPFHLKVS